MWEENKFFKLKFEVCLETFNCKQTHFTLIYFCRIERSDKIEQ